MYKDHEDLQRELACFFFLYIKFCILVGQVAVKASQREKGHTGHDFVAPLSFL